MINDVPTRLTAPRHGQPMRGGFTLVELMVSIAILLLLVGMLLPALKRGVEAGRQTSCLNNLRQIALATQQYCLENENVYPSAANLADPPQTSDWIFWRPGLAAPFDDTSKSAVGRYLGQRAAAIFRCPSDTWDVRPPNGYSNIPYQFSYSMNAFIGWNGSFSQRWYRAQDVINPSIKILYADEDIETIDDGTWLPTMWGLHNELSTRHDYQHQKDDPDCRGNVVFCDGHAESVRRDYSWTSDHYLPKP